MSDTEAVAGQLDSDVTLIEADVLEGLRMIAPNSIHCVITSPPYFGLRDYGVAPTTWVDGELAVLGTEAAVGDYVRHLGEVASEIMRVLRPDGTFWLNLGDRYASGGKHEEPDIYASADGVKLTGTRQRGVSPKCLLMVPERVAFRLIADGWTLRQRNVWHKPNAMCEPVRDRTTAAHEFVYHLVKADRYYYDVAATAEPLAASSAARYRRVIDTAETYDPSRHKPGPTGTQPSPMAVLTRAAAGVVARGTRQKRNVWTIPTQPFPGAHFACWPERLVEVMVAAGCPVGGVVLDPFCGGSGRAARVTRRQGKDFIGIDANGEYLRMTEQELMMPSRRRRRQSAADEYKQEVESAYAAHTDVRR